MAPAAYPYAMRQRSIDRVVKLIQIFFKTERDMLRDTRVIKRHVETLIETKGDQILDDNGEVLMKPGHKVFEELDYLLRLPDLKKWKGPKEPSAQQSLFEETKNYFNGLRKFSPEKIDAMIVHLAYRGKNVNPTKLNKLLFYSDFSYFRKRKIGISGAEYLALTHGPVFGNYDNEIKILEKRNQIRIIKIKSKGNPARVILATESYRPEISVLSKEEIRFLDWVVETYDHLSTKELIAMSHREMAYWDTNWKQPINYEYSKYLEYEPPDSLLDD